MNTSNKRRQKEVPDNEALADARERERVAAAAAAAAAKRSVWGDYYSERGLENGNSKFRSTVRLYFTPRARNIISYYLIRKARIMRLWPAIQRPRFPL